MTTDTDALIATVREALTSWQMQTLNQQRDNAQKARAALDSLAAELERVKAERDAALDREAGTSDALQEWQDRTVELKARLDKALTALREIHEARLEVVRDPIGQYAALCTKAGAAIAEIEGEA